MRLSNKHKVGFYNFLHTLTLIIIIGGFILFLLEIFKFNLLGWQQYFLIVIPLLLAWIVHLRGRQIFEYDSDGETLNFKNRNIVSYLDKPINDDFPKYKLLKYEVINAFIFKRLYITIASKKEYQTTVLKYDISYLTQREIRDLKISLNKVVKANKEKRSQTSGKIQ